MSNKKSFIGILLITTFLLCLIIFISYFQHRIPPNPKNTIGNTAGNLNNKGLFCEKEGIIYFSNAYANGALYSMNADGTNLKQLSNSSVEYINAAGNYLYFYLKSSSSSSGLGSVRNFSGVFRSTKSGNNFTCINSDPSQVVALIDDYIYYQHYDVDHGMTLYKTRTDKKNQAKLTDYIINPASVQNGIIYYSGVEKDHYLYSFNTENDSSSLVWAYDVFNPIVQDDFIYYMDVSNNYALCRYNINTQETQTLTTERIDHYNILNNVIFYQVSSKNSPMLMRMNADGSAIEVVAKGIYENINLTSQYAFFNEYDSPVPVFMTNTTGPINVTTFDAARDAALQNR